MVRLLFSVLLLSLSCAAACAAALVPIQHRSHRCRLRVNKISAFACPLFASIPEAPAAKRSPAKSVLYSPLGVALNPVASNPDPTVSSSDPLPGLLNTYTAANPNKWATGIPRYGTANLVYPSRTGVVICAIDCGQ